MRACREAANGPDGLRIAENDPPDLIFLDIQMPGMDGLEVLKRLRDVVPITPVVLDEVGDMSLRTQAKVLRVLQDGEVERIGARRTEEVDVRVIAATNRKLEDLVVNGSFREDLYYRLSVFPIHIPPLRELEESPRCRRWLAARRRGRWARPS